MAIRPFRMSVLLMVGLFISCKGHPPPEDTDKELFRTPEALTQARELNIAKWTADFLRAKGRLPASVSELTLPEASSDPKENPMNDAWGRRILLSPHGQGFEVRSYGADGQPNTADDLVHRVDNPAAIQ